MVVVSKAGALFKYTCSPRQFPGSESLIVRLLSLSLSFSFLLLQSHNPAARPDDKLNAIGPPAPGLFKAGQEGREVQGKPLVAKQPRSFSGVWYMAGGLMKPCILLHEGCL